MKTQLLEDIGESAALSPLVSRPEANTKAGKAPPARVPTLDAQPAAARFAAGVWRQKPSAEPVSLAPPPPPMADPAPLELDKVFDELAALEAQFVHPVEPAPAMATPAPQEAVPDSPTEPLPAPVAEPAQAAVPPEPARDASASHDPLFDFTLPSPTPYVADPFTPVPPRFTQSRKRALVWATCALSGALLIWGGLALYQERKDTEALTLVASEAKQAARTDTPFEARAIAAAAPAQPPGPDAPVQQAAPASTPAPDLPAPDLPPLVMLEPDPPPAVKPKPPAPAPKAARAVAQRSATPAPRPSVRKTREPPSAPTRAARDKPKREPVRQLAQASAITPDKPSEADTSLAATLRACREHGYHATQCIKRQCAVGKYGFACRGR